MNKVYTPEQVEFMRKHYPGTPLLDFTQMFNKRYGTSFKVAAISSALYTRGIKNGLCGEFTKGVRSSPATEFTKGHVPFNKGRKGIRMSPDTEFKKGHIPMNHKPIGSERICVDGYTWVKVKEPKTWREKHRIVYEEHHGPIPKGHAVIFADSNRQNFGPDNLILVSRGELAVMNTKGLITKNAELTKSGVATARLLMKITERNRSRKEKK